MLTIHNVAIPISDPKRFMTPHWYEVLSYYRDYCHFATQAGFEPYQIQAYIWEVCRYLESSKARTEDDGRVRKAHEWLSRLFEHWGVDYHTKFE